MSENKGPETPRPVVSETPVPPAIDPMMYALGAIGAVIGAALGVGVFWFALRSGFYAEVVIGVLAGWIGGMMSRRPSWAVGAIAGVGTLFTGLWAEWRFVAPMIADDSFLYFVTHVHHLAPFKLLWHAVGVVAAVWIAARR
jgi:hypothetical protein